MTGWIIALVAAAVLFGIGAVFCAPFSPVHKKIEAEKNRPTAATETINSDGTGGRN